MITSLCQPRKWEKYKYKIQEACGRTCSRERETAWEDHSLLPGEPFRSNEKQRQGGTKRAFLGDAQAGKHVAHLKAWVISVSRTWLALRHHTLQARALGRQTLRAGKFHFQGSTTRAMLSGCNMSEVGKHWARSEGIISALHTAPFQVNAVAQWHLNGIRSQKLYSVHAWYS